MKYSLLRIMSLSFIILILSTLYDLIISMHLFYPYFIVEYRKNCSKQLNVSLIMDLILKFCQIILLLQMSQSLIKKEFEFAEPSKIFFMGLLVF